MAGSGTEKPRRNREKRSLHFVAYSCIPKLAWDIVGCRIEIVQAARKAGWRIIIEDVVNTDCKGKALVEKSGRKDQLDITIKAAVQFVDCACFLNARNVAPALDKSL